MQLVAATTGGMGAGGEQAAAVDKPRVAASLDASGAPAQTALPAPGRARVAPTPRAVRSAPRAAEGDVAARSDTAGATGLEGLSVTSDRPVHVAEAEGVSESVALLSVPAPPRDAGARPAGADSGGAADSVDSPVYPTRLPPAMTLHYSLSRGPVSGRGDLVWEPSGAGYKLHLEGRAIGLTLLTQTSAGALDAAGIAPVRFTDRRMRSAARAANFQRERGVVSFSGPRDEFALHPGMQDRLSWMVQLPAIVAADPARSRPGAVTVLTVVGARAPQSRQTPALHRWASC